MKEVNNILKILLLITKRNYNILRISYILEKKGHEVKTIFVDHFQSCHSYLDKKLDEWHISDGKNKYDRGIFNMAMEYINDWGAERAFFVNYGFRSEWRAEFRDRLINANCKLIGWVIDPADIGNHDNREIYSFYDKIYFYERCDAESISKNFSINAEYCPVGFNDSYCKNKNIDEYKYDIVFVGSPYKSRLKVLEKLSKVSWKNGWKLRIFGPFFNEGRYFWKKYQKQWKYPYIKKFLHDGVFTSDEVAEIYRKSKICLNLHTDIAKGMNPRSYEIIATGAFQLMDKRRSYDTLQVGDGFEEFADFDDMLEKIDYYLKNEDKRQEIIDTGQKKISAYSMERCLFRMLDLK